MINRVLAAAALVPALLLAASGAAAAADLPAQSLGAEFHFRDWPGRWVAGTVTDGLASSSGGGAVAVSSATPARCQVQPGTGNAFTVRFLEGGTCTVHAAAAGTADYAPTSADWALEAEPKQVRRLSGPDRVGTSVDTSRFLHPSTRQTTGAVLATTAGFADALAAAGPSALKQQPLLLNPVDHLDQRVADELTRLLTPGSRVTLVGGRSALSEAVEAAVRALPGGFSVLRIAGDDRYGTAAALVQDRPEDHPGVVVDLPYSGPLYLVSGTDWPDGLSVAPLAAHTYGAVLLTGPGGTLPPATRAGVDAALAAGRRVVAVGGPAARGFPAASRAIVGADRYETSRLVSDEIVAATDYAAPRRVVFASGASWPDALVGATVAGQWALDGDTQGPLLLTPPDQLTDPTRAALQRIGTDTVYEVYLSGGTTALTPALEAQVREAFVVRP